jgi:hypothetical protein
MVVTGMRAAVTTRENGDDDDHRRHDRGEKQEIERQDILRRSAQGKAGRKKGPARRGTKDLWVALRRKASYQTSDRAGSYARTNLPAILFKTGLTAI